MKDPKFLRSILPLSTELDSILRRIFEYNPAKRTTIPELRELILRCPRFTTRSAAPAPLPSPPFRPVDYARGAAFNRIYQPGTAPPAAPLPAPLFTPTPLDLPFPQPSTSTGSSNSDNDSVFSSSSSISSASSTSSFTHVTTAPKGVPRGLQPSYVSPPSHAWYNSFLQAANLVKHVSFQPPLMAAPVHVY